MRTISYIVIAYYVTIFLSPLLSIESSTDQEVADYLGIQVEEIQTIMEAEKLDDVHIAVAAVVAKKSDKPFIKVVKDQKKYRKNIDQFIRNYRFPPEEIWEECKQYFPKVIWYPRIFLRDQDLLARTLAIYLSEDDQQLLQIIRKEDYSTLSAAIIAKISGKKINDILTRKKKMSWEELKRDLNIHPTQIIREQKRLKQILNQELQQHDSNHTSAIPL